MSNTLSFDYLQDLDTRFRAGLAALPSARDNRAITWSGVGFRIGKQHCVTAMDDIAEVLTEPAATRLPGVKGEIYLGLIVDDVFGMQHFNAETFRLDSELQVSTIANYVQGCYEHAKRQWVVFRPVQLIEDDNFYTVAA